jgi:putative PIN family toxin of toxin-antitoxin system
LRLVIDCNVVVAAARGSRTCRLVLLRAVAGHELLVSEPILAEYREVGARPKHQAHHAVLQVIVDTLAAVATMVEPSETRFDLGDPDDEVYLATAVAGAAEALVTGNRRHFTRDRYGDVEVLSPRAFLDRLG